jgi:hypothetical protein
VIALGFRGHSRDSLNRYVGCLADSPAFEGHAVAIQRKMRDEWNQTAHRL